MPLMHGSQLSYPRGGLVACRFAGFLVCGRDPRPLLFHSLVVAAFFLFCFFFFFRFPESHLPFLNPSSQVCCFVYRPVPPIITGRFARGISRGHPINPSPLRRWLSIVTDINNPLCLCLITTCSALLLPIFIPPPLIYFLSTQFQPSHFPIWLNWFL